MAGESSGGRADVVAAPTALSDSWIPLDVR
jgi:hypothetical protein